MVMAGTVSVLVVLFALTLWLGLYLLVRSYDSERVWWTGFGLVAYAIGLAFIALRPADSVGSPAWDRLARLVAVLPAVLWGNALLTFLPSNTLLALNWRRVWRYAIVPLTLLAALLGPQAPSGSLLLIAITPLFALVATLLWALRWREQRPFRSRSGRKAAPLSARQRRSSMGDARVSAWLALAVTIFLALATGMVVATVGVIGTGIWWYLAMGADLLILGYLIATLDAWEQRERLWPDMLRSLDAAALKSLLFGLPVAVTMLWATGQTRPMVLLLFVVVGMALLVQELAGPIDDILDRAAFAAMPWLRSARRDLRETATALPKVDLGLDMTDMDDDEFVRLTRRALSHLGNLPRLASSPLTNLDVVRQVVGSSGDDHTLARAAALKQILTDSIMQLKPSTEADFGTTDEWRHYNALYFPYVVGLKPFSRRYDHGEIGDIEREALDWFQAQVPERTLYHWQSAAAELVAQHVAELNAAARNGG